MKRWYARVATKRFVGFAALTVAALLAAIVAPRGQSQQTRLKLPIALPAAIPPDAGYQVQDGSIIHGGSNAQPTGAKTGVGEVDTLDLSKAYSRAEQLQGQAKGRVFKATITPHWFAGNTKFWYRNDTKGGTKDFVVVDAEKGTRLAAFDHDKLAAALAQAAGGKFQGAALPFSTIEFIDNGKAVRFSVEGKAWQCDLTTYECTRAAAGPPEEIELPAPTAEDGLDHSQNSYDPYPAEELSPEESAVQKKGQAKDQKKGKGNQPTAREAKSPDMKWTAFIKDRNVWLRDAEGKETQVTDNGVEGDAYTAVGWSPDSKAVVAFRSTPGDDKTVYLFESSPKDQLPAKIHERPYPRPGDKFATHEMWLINVADMKSTKVDIERIDFRGIPRLRWNKDNLHFTFEKTDRGHQRFRVVEVDARSGNTRSIIDEKADVMVNHYADGQGNTVKNHTFFLQYFDDTGELLYLSEMDGWKHLYLIDAKTAQLKQITKGEWVVRKIEKVDAQKRQIWFLASGKNTEQDPYLLHYFRINFDGSGLVALTDGNGTHTIEYSPDAKYLIDTYSRVDMAPRHELRRVADGSKVCDLEKADVSALEATGWRFPEVFSAKGRDGQTDIWGIVCRPQNFDPKKKYPVIEYIYAGPHSSHVPKTFSAYRQMAALAELGFIVVQIDGMGTMNRSRAFHDVCWKNLADAGFPDRILWIKALAQKYAYVDISRVGIYGTSAGGQNALGALLFHPEFYKVAVAACGCHDNRLDKSSWNESWMGLMGPHYAANSNITHAPKLQGRLLLIVGEMDTNVPPESTYRVVDALIKAKKDFDLIVVPGMGHSSGGPHGERRKNDFFVQHLLGVVPPNHNALAGQE
jgi:dipeptidyl aminopeptidase/acylaminoacyl peptidase